jgi:hypothetical protein
LASPANRAATFIGSTHLVVALNMVASLWRSRPQRQWRKHGDGVACVQHTRDHAPRVDPGKHRGVAEQSGDTDPATLSRHAQSRAQLHEHGDCRLVPTIVGEPGKPAQSTNANVR